MKISKTRKKNRCKYREIHKFPLRGSFFIIPLFTFIR